MNKTFSAQFVPFLVLLALIIGVGLYVSDIGVMTTHPENTEVAADTSGSAEALPLTNSVTNESLGLTLEYPDTWQADATQPQAIVLASTENPQNQQMQVRLTSVEDISQNFFRLETVPEDPTPLNLLNAFSEVAPSISPALQITNAVAPKTIENFDGGTITISQTNPQTGEVSYLVISLFDVPDDDRVLTTLLASPENQLSSLSATLDNIIASIEIGESASTTEAEATVEATETPAETVEPTSEPTSEPEATTSAPTEEAVTEEPTATPAPVSEEPLPLVDSVTNDLLGLALEYPDGWQADTTQPQAIILESTENPENQMQILLMSAEDVAQNLFGLETVPEDPTPLNLLNAFSEQVPSISPALQVANAVTPKTVEDFDGGTVTISQTNPQTGEVSYLAVNLFDVPDDDRVLTTLLISPEDQLSSLSATLDNVIASIEISGPAEATETPSESAEPTSEPTSEPEATEAPTSAPTEEAVTEEPTVEPTVEPTTEPTEAAAAPTAEVDEGDEEVVEDAEDAEPEIIEALPLGDTFTDEEIGLTVAVPEGFEARSRTPFTYVELDETTIRLTVNDVVTVANQHLGLEIDDAPNNDVAVNLLRQFTRNADEEYDFISGLTVSNSGTQAYVDLTRDDIKRRVVLRELDDGRLLFVEAAAPVDNFDVVSATLMDMLDTVETE